MIPRHVPLVETTRGGTTECVHYGSIAVVDASGQLISAVGDPESLNFTRSALKPLQALPFVEDGGLGRYRLHVARTGADVCQPQRRGVHIGVVQRMSGGGRSRRVGAAVRLPCAGVLCGDRINRAVGREVVAAVSQLFRQACGLPCLRAHARPADRVLSRQRPPAAATHPHDVARFAQGDAIAQGIDGCSAPNFALPLRRLAQTYARLAAQETPELAALVLRDDAAPGPRVRYARTDLAIMQTGAGDWVSKSGADGMQAIGVASKGMGIAIRVADGSPRALHAATVEVLQQIGLLEDSSGTPLAAYDCPPIRNYHGIETGGFVPVFTLRRQAG